MERGRFVGTWHYDKNFKKTKTEAIRRIFYMACEYLTKGNCGALFNVKISEGVAHLCGANYKNCPRYQFVSSKKKANLP